MKTTLDLPDALMREIKVRAAREDRKLKELVAELLTRGLAAERPARPAVPRRVKLPLIDGTHPATPETEMTPERIAEVFDQLDLELVSDK
jgi:plasmid stability protein